MNDLKNSLSPYLLQHKDNPVFWHEWSEAAFAKAKIRNIPIFLSIGYAACHWCHVMAHESFEDQETADYLNQHFISIKVDREERPDIDNIYMQALLQFTGHGGWPLNMFLTPDGKPFYGGTYFPKSPRYGQIPFLTLLKQIHDAWHQNQTEIFQSTENLTRVLGQKIKKPPQTQTINFDLLKTQQKHILSQIDYQHGGLHGATKFPQISLWKLLFSMAIAGQEPNLIDACYFTAKKICNGGIYDHLGGGFARYSTDASWLVPHFEKMLYDNAQIIEWLTMLYTFRPEPLFFQRISETIEWLRREMLLPEGTFAASLNADSEGVEGKYYIWDWQELENVLNQDAKDFADFYGASQLGNWEGKNVLHRNHENPTHLSSTKISTLKQKLLSTRQQRIAPSRDDKILLDWNALIVIALAKAGQAFNKQEWIALAKQTYAALIQLLKHNNGWFHAYRSRKYQNQSQLEDYANMIQAAIVLYSVTGLDKYLSQAKVWLADTNQKFLDKENHLYYQNAANSERLIVNLQPVMDNATPSGNGTMALNLIQLYLITGNADYFNAWENLIHTLHDYLHSEHSFYFSTLLFSSLWYLSGIKIEADWEKIFNLESKLSIKPFWLLLNEPNAKSINCCNYQKCFAQFTSINELANL